MRRWDEMKEGAGRREPGRRLRRRMSCRSPTVLTPTTSIGRTTQVTEMATETHITSTPSCIDTNHVDREDNASHVNGGTSPFPPLR